MKNISQTKEIIKIKTEKNTKIRTPNLKEKHKTNKRTHINAKVRVPRAAR